jgi:protein-S-isoprenylcysteine O-methyltransferase Ste14
MWWLVLGLHLCFWAPFVVRGRIDRATGRAMEKPAVHKASSPTALVWMHALGVLPTYLGIGIGLVAGAVVALPLAARLSGIAVILGGMWLVIRVLLVFRSWRLRAELAADHELCTDGPFRTIRHPIYVALVLLCAGSFLLVPNASTLVGLLTTVLTGDVRARAEEKLLVGAFGDRYLAYMQRTKRFFPGIY